MVCLYSNILSVYHISNGLLHDRIKSLCLFKHSDNVWADPSGLAFDVCGRSIVGIEGSNPPDGMDVLSCVFVCGVGSGLCYELIIRSEESYRVCMCVCVCVCMRA